MDLPVDLPAILRQFEAWYGGDVADRRTSWRRSSAAIRHLKPQGVWSTFFGGSSEEDAHRFVREVGKRSNWA
jgi:hypothetical protein